MTVHASCGMVCSFQCNSRWLSQEELACNLSAAPHPDLFAECIRSLQFFRTEYFEEIEVIFFLLSCSLKQYLGNHLCHSEENVLLWILPWNVIGRAFKWSNLLNFNSLGKFSNRFPLMFQPMQLRKFAQEMNI